MSMTFAQRQVRELRVFIVNFRQHGVLHCDDCGKNCTDYQYAVQHDPWERETGEVWCENCHEARWDRQQEHLMETT